MLTTLVPKIHMWISLLPFLCSLGTLIHAAEFSFSIVDSATQQPVAARVYLQNVDSGTRHFVRALSATDAVIYERQNWANKNSIEHHTSLPAAPFIAENLPAGSYLLTIERGKEYFTETRRIVLAEGESRLIETIELRRWINMEERGWFSGETHLHRPLSELPVVMQAEDLNVAMPLTYWVTQAFTAPSQGNKNQSGEIPDQLIELDSTHVIWPRNTEYEIFTVGEHQHTLGALFVLNHHSILSQGAPDWKPIAEQAKSEGALMDMDKLDWPFAMTLPHTTGATLYELANNHIWRTEFGLTQWNSEAPAFLQPPNGGKEGNEHDWLAYTLGQYYTLLNAGFPLVPTAGTASGVHPVPAGFSRVYVNLDGPFSYNKWIEGLAAGHSFVTTGPMMFAEVNGEQPGAAITNDRISISAKIVSEHPLATIEVVVNGQVVKTLMPQNELTPEGARQSEVATELPIETSGWICLRCTEDRPDKRLRFAHTAPWWLDIPGKPLRPSQQEKDYLIQRVQQEIVRSTGILPESAIAEYRAALRHFESLTAAGSKSDDVSANVEPIPEKLVVLTFDDSVKSHFTVVRPILLKHGFSATFFITEGFDFKENKRDYMTWEEIAQLHRDGFEIGNHTRDHLGISDDNLDQLPQQLKAINDRCAEYDIPQPTSFSWPGNSLALTGLDALSKAGIRFARRGGAPEEAYETGRGFAYEPMLDDPLLIPSAGDARPDWEMEDFVRAVEQARYGRIAVLQFHGVPDTAHNWVNTPKAKFEQYMRYLAQEGYQVIALRDLDRYVDPDIKPQDPMGVINDRKAMLANHTDYENFRCPKNDEDLAFWLRNMIVDHHYSIAEASSSTGLSSEQIKSAIERLKIDGPSNLPEGQVRVLPYPGGRHPRIGFRDGAIRPQRETKLSLFLPWDPQAYVVADIPEAIWWTQQDGRELLYLAHTHIKTSWDLRGQSLKPTEWQRTEAGWSVVKQLPNGVEFGCEAEPHEDVVQMKLWIRNGSDEPLSGLVVQNCIMLASATGFEAMTSDNKLIRSPFVACHNADKSHWIITAWQNCIRPWANPHCPCMHSDPQFPDCPPGETRQLKGVVSFYVGTDIDAALKRLEPLLAD